MEKELGNLKKRATFCGTYKFLGHHFLIRSDSQQVLDKFKAIYRHFELDGTSSKEDELTCYLLSNTPLNKPIIIFDQSCYPLKSPEITPNTYSFIFTLVASRFKEYFLIHGGTVSWKDKGVIISGHSTFGKTTLIIELVKRGFRFLSDELAPIHRSSHKIVPFPRSLGVREGALRLFKGLLEKSWKVCCNHHEDRQCIIDIEDIYQGKIGAPCKPRYVIFLTPNLDEGPGEKGNLKFLEIALNGVNQDLIRDLRTIDGVIDVFEVPGREYPVLRLLLDAKKRIAGKLKEIYDVHKDSILYSVRGKTQASDFNASPVLTSISKTQGIMELMPMILSGYQLTMVDDVFDGSPCRMVMELADIAKDIRFYQLSMGKLDEMGELITQLVSDNFTISGCPIFRKNGYLLLTD